MSILSCPYYCVKISGFSRDLAYIADSIRLVTCMTVCALVEVKDRLVIAFLIHPSLSEYNALLS